MKKTSTFIAFIAFLMTMGAQNPVKMNFVHKHDTVYYSAYMKLPDGNSPFSVVKGYDIQWPIDATDELKRKLTQKGFNDNSGLINSAIKRFDKDLLLYEEDTLLQIVLTDRLPSDYDEYPGNFEFINVNYTKNDNLYTFDIFDMIYIFPAAHQNFSFCYIVFDSDRQKIVELSELLDTTQLKPLLRRAISELSINDEVSECMFEDDFLPEIPLTNNYYIDRNNNTIKLVYHPYEIAPFGCGSMTVSLPIQWLQKRLKLTPYCLKLFKMQ